MNQSSDYNFLQERYAVARNRYKPATIKVLLLAEAPPESLDRYFYFDDVKTQDSLFLEIMGVLYPEQKAQYLASGRETLLKRELLHRFQEDGYWLMDLSEVPCSLSGNHLENCLPSLLQRLKKHVSRQTPIVLIKANIFDICYSKLMSEGYSVLNERLPFPGSGQQRVFREKFKKVLASV